MRNLEQFKNNYLESAIRENFGDEKIDDVKRNELLSKIKGKLEEIKGMVGEGKKEEKETFIASLDGDKKTYILLGIIAVLSATCVYLYFRKK